MECECKQCGNIFTKSFGTLKCPNCKSKDLWIITGITKQIFLTLVIIVIFLVIAIFIHLLVFYVFLIGFLLAFPASIWSMLRKRKKSS